MSEALAEFLKRVADDPHLQARCAAATNLAQQVELAQAAGYAISARELQLWASDEAFTADWWPWAGVDGEQRLAFFRGQSR